MLNESLSHIDDDMDFITITELQSTNSFHHIVSGQQFGGARILLPVVRICRKKNKIINYCRLQSCLSRWTHTQFALNMPQSLAKVNNLPGGRHHV